MKVKVGSIIISTIEYPGEISLVIFLSGCPLKCPYCHNVGLLENFSEMSIETLLSKIDSHSDFVDAVVVSGGEPLMQIDVTESILKHAKSIGLKTKIDTSGCYSNSLERILPLLDYVGLDIKAPFDKYNDIIGSNIGTQVYNSMELVNDSSAFLECRTTYVPTLLTPEDVYRIAEEVKCDMYAIQQFNNKQTLKSELAAVSMPLPQEIKKLGLKVKPLNEKTIIRSFEFGKEEI